MPYENPDRIPPVGGYTWVPAGLPSGDATASRGFKQAINYIGEIRNDLPYISTSNSGTLDISYTGNILSSPVLETAPIYNTFRFLQRQSGYRSLPPSLPFILGGDFSYTITIRNSVPISGMQLSYSLACDINDTALDSLITDQAQLALLQSSRTSGTVNPDLDLGAILAGQITVDGVEYPTTSLSDLPKELPITEFYTNLDTFKNSTLYTKRVIRFGNNSFITTGFASPKTIVIKSRKTIPTLVIKLFKISLFNPVRANLDSDQVPAAAISYAFPILFKVSYGFANLTYPSNFKNRGTINVKVYSRDYLESSPGFAHSINLRFLIASFPIVSIDPFSLLSGFGNNIAGGLYFYWFLGLWPERRNLKFQLSSKYFSYKNSSRVIKAYSVAFPKNVGSFVIYDTVSTSTPGDDSVWRLIPNSFVRINTSVISTNKYYYDPGPYNSEFIGGKTKPFTLVDTESTDNTWYRLNFSDNTNSSPIKADPHYETNPLLLTTTQVGADILEIERKPYNPFPPLSENKPIALFVSGDTYVPYTLDLNKDSFKVMLEAKKTDPNEYSYTHLYFRFWFVPENYGEDLSNIYKYQDDYEVRFVTNSAKTYLEVGKPRELTECIVSPPISNEYQKLSIARYVNNDSTINTADSFLSSKNYYINGALIQNWKLCMGVYSVSYPNVVKNPGLTQEYLDYPNITLKIDPSYAALETPFNYVHTTTSLLEGSKLPQFTQITDTDYSKISLVNCRTGNIKIDTTVADYTQLATFPSTEYVDNSFKNLINLKNDKDIATYKYENVAVTIPFSGLSSIPANLDENTVVNADFCTDGQLLSRGQIGAGTWTIDHVFVASGTCQIKVEAYLLNYNGQIVFNIFKSDYINPISISTSFNISVPFTIPEGNYQIVFRIKAYPYGDGTSLNVNSFIVSANTIQYRTVVENDSAGGSVAFFEDLPLTPTRTIEDNQFWFIASDDLLKGPVLSDSNGEFTVTGCLYSPSWLTTLPENTDVDYYTYGLGTNPILFRTVPGKSETLDSISAEENKFDGEIAVAYNTNSTVSTTKGAVEILHTSNTSTAFSDNTVIKQGDNYFEGKNPSIFTSNKTKNNLNSEFFVIAENDGIDGKQTSIASNISDLNRNGWSKYNQGNNEYDFTSKTVLTSGLSFTNIKVSDQVPLTYVTGITQPGSVILKISEMNLAYTTAPDSKNYLIDGPDVNYPDVFPQLIKSDLNTSIAANVNPAIVLDKYRSATILYVMSDSRYKIFAKRVTNNKISQKVEALNLSNYLDGVSGNASINGIDAVYDDKNNLIHLLLHLSNSIYYASIPYIKDNSYFGSGFYNLHFVAGDTGANNSILSTLKTNNRVFFDSSTENEGNIPNQKPSLVLLSKKGKSGKIMAWYKNSSGAIVSKEIIPYGKTFSSNKYQGL
jgi:hypothetical protein